MVDPFAQLRCSDAGALEFDQRGSEARAWVFNDGQQPCIQRGFSSDVGINSLDISGLHFYCFLIYYELCFFGGILAIFSSMFVGN